MTNLCMIDLIGQLLAHLFSPVIAAIFHLVSPGVQCANLAIFIVLPCSTCYIVIMLFKSKFYGLLHVFRFHSLHLNYGSRQSNRHWLHILHRRYISSCLFLSKYALPFLILAPCPFPTEPACDGQPIIFPAPDGSGCLAAQLEGCPVLLLPLQDMVMSRSPSDMFFTDQSPSTFFSETWARLQAMSAVHTGVIPHYTEPLIVITFHVVCTNKFTHGAIPCSMPELCMHS